jgi:beta-glucanase (GH16 family)
MNRRSVAQVSKPAVSPISKSACRPNADRKFKVTAFLRPLGFNASTLQRFNVFGALFGLSLLVTPHVALATPPSGYYEVWGDEFNESSLDTTRWDYWLLGSRRDAINVTNAVSLNGSNLVITTYTSNDVHYTAMIATDETFRSRYGYWEASIEWGDTNGMWSAFWFQSPTMGTWLYDPFVSGSEIDIVEHRATDGGADGDIMNIVQNNIHWNGYGSAAKSAGSGNIGSGLGSGFHTYGFLWTPTAYTIHIDGSNLRLWNYSNNGVPVSESTEWTILSSEMDDTSTTWAGEIPTNGYGSLAASTTKLTVDYVRYYAPTNTIFWTGAADGLGLTNSANFVSNMPPLSTSDLTFSYLSGTNLNLKLSADLAIDGLVFLNMDNAVTIGGTNTLTLGSGGIDMVAANHTVTINCPVNVSASQTWLVGISNPGDTLDLNGNIGGSGTLSKGNWGTLILNGTNTFSGTLNVDLANTSSGSSGISDGIVRITRSQNVQNITTIGIRDNNGAWSTLQLTNLLGNVSVPANITLAGRNTNVVAIENMSGSNTLSGNVSITSGGGFYLLQSDAGTLNFGGTITASSTATGTRTFTFQGAGNFLVSGSFQNGSATTINIAKSNSGTLTFSGVNALSGTVTNWAGSLIVNGSLVCPLAVAAGELAGTGTIGGAASIQSGATLAPANLAAGILNFGNSLILNAGSTSIFQIHKTLQTNDSVVVTGAQALGGTLIVTNLAGNLAAGDSFQLFSAGTFSGNFSSFTLPTLGTGLAWNTNGLTNGVLSVISIAAPQFGSLSRRADGNFVFSATGAAYTTYNLDAASNLSPPIIWLVITSTIADPSGTFQLSDLLATNFPSRFYRITSEQ